ncbi:MAG TPA: hypothetical protein VGI75_11895 [Pirellulales bacterium]|jgi:hypothetical protein
MLDYCPKVARLRRLPWANGFNAFGVKMDSIAHHIIEPGIGNEPRFMLRWGRRGGDLHAALNDPMQIGPMSDKAMLAPWERSGYHNNLAYCVWT